MHHTITIVNDRVAIAWISYYTANSFRTTMLSCCRIDQLQSSYNKKFENKQQN